MRKINKQAPPDDLDKYVRGENPQKFEEIHHSKYYPKLYGECIDALKAEQNNLSGYTEKPLSSGIHIDHFRKQALFNTQNMVFGWNNMIADEHHLGFGADIKDAVVKTSIDNNRLINPVLDDPHHFLTYMDEGIIKPVDGLSKADKDKAEYTITAFNLKHKLLTEKRRIAISLVKTYKSQNLTDEEILGAMKDYGFTSAVEFALSDD